MNKRNFIKFKEDLNWCYQGGLRTVVGTLMAIAYPIVGAFELAYTIKNQKQTNKNLKFKDVMSISYDYICDGIEELFIGLPKLVFEDMDEYGSKRALEKYDAAQRAKTAKNTGKSR